MTIYKYELEVTDEQIVLLPKEAKILCVQEQHGGPKLWALLNPEEPLEPRLIRTCGTGHLIKDIKRLHYLGTYQLHNGTLVFHVFEDKRS